MKAIIPITYLAPISLFVDIYEYDEIVIEKKEFFIKQSVRNRCDVVGASGKLNLSVPTVRKGREKTLVDSVKICHDTPWNAIHWRSFCTAYRSSPFFEYYEDDFEAIFVQEWETLFDFNQALFLLILKKLKLTCNISYTDEFILDHGIKDFRPKYGRNFKDKGEYPRYIQVFEDKLGFVPNLSIVDLLFNEGPLAKDYLQNISEKRK